jgi:cell division protein FtsW
MRRVGYVGACLVLMLFVLLILRGFWIALKARDRFGSLLAMELRLLALQTFLNIAVVTNLSRDGVSLLF